jgi:hypothetical protein
MGCARIERMGYARTRCLKAAAMIFIAQNGGSVGVKLKRWTSIASAPCAVSTT